MIFQIFVCLLLLALLTLLVAKSRLRRGWTAVMVAGGGFLLYQLWEALHLRETSIFVYDWLSYRGLQAALNLSSNLELEQMLMPLFAVSLLVVYYNGIYQPEQHRLSVGSIILLNLASFILLADSADFIQLMVGSSAFTLLGFYLINNLEAKRKFIFYGFLGEMALFAALAVVYSRLGTISLGDLARYQDGGQHKDLVALLLLFAIIVKAGIFPLQNQLLDLQNLTFNRIIVFCFTAAPLAAFALFIKLHPLLLISDLTQPLLLGLLAISLLWGTVGSIIIDNIKAKALYINLMYYSFVLALVVQDWQNFGRIAVWLFLPLLALNVVLMMVNLSSSNETYVSQMGGFARRLKWTFLLSLAAVFIFAAGTLRLAFALPLSWTALFLAGLLAALAQIFHDVYLSRSRADERVEALLQNVGPHYWLPLLLLIGTFCRQYRLYVSQTAWIVFAVFVAALLAGPFSFARRWADDEELQEADLVERLSRFLIVEPLRLLGRILWIAVDFVVIERSIIGTVSDSTRFMVSGLHKIQNTAWANYLLMVFLGLGIIVISIGYYCHE